MARRDPKALVPDFHLWSTVAETVDPLRPARRKGRASLGEALPLPAASEGVQLDAPSRAKVRHPNPIAMPAYRGGTPSAPAPETRIEPRLARKLRRGHLEIDATIDLHGMYQDEARAALNRFIPARAARGDRTILVITGKGLKKTDAYATVIVERGVLRSMLPVWLSEPHLRPLVSGWNSAAQSHGGEGAFYVRLRPMR
jgi:DNA-nicking Smr family endonuclease